MIVLDRYINKPIKINDNLKLKVWEKIIFSYDWRKSIWIVLWYECHSEKEWIFISILEWKEKEKFENKQKEVKEYFNIFKIEFKKFFPLAIPITARFDIFNDKVYFYYYLEDRLDFRDFLKFFLKKVPYQVFLYQVWARDMIRYSEKIEIWCCQISKVCCKTYKCPLPTVENESIYIQSLWHRDDEFLKWHCWKLKCCLNYELDFYNEKSILYPKIWEYFEYEWKKYLCQWYNMLTWTLVWKDESWKIVYIKYLENV